VKDTKLGDDVAVHKLTLININ